MKIPFATYLTIGFHASYYGRLARAMATADTLATAMNDGMDTYDDVEEHSLRHLQLDSSFQIELLKDIFPGPTSSLPSRSDCISIRTGVCESGRPVCDLAFFVADDGVNGPEPWITDGTAQGTVFLKDINPGPIGIEIGWRYPLVTRNLLFFSVDDGGADGMDLWVTNGTPGGTRKVNLVHEGAVAVNPGYFQPLNGFLYFFASDPVGGIQLWRSDGTDTNTVRVTNTPGGFVGFPSRLVDVNNQNFLLFDPPSAAGDGLRSLWSTDGTEAGTIQLMGDVVDGRLSRTGRSPSLLESNDYVYFGVTESGVSAMWRTDGTLSGTALVKSGVLPFVVNRRWLDAERTLFFTDSGGSEELWVTDGTSAGTFPLATTFSDILNFFGKNGIFADNGTTGLELFISDGTVAGTSLYFEFVPGTQGVSPETANTLECDGPVLLGLFAGNGTYQVWNVPVDFTGPAPVKLREFISNGDDSESHSMVSMGFGSAIITGYDSSVGVELWKVTKQGGAGPPPQPPSQGFRSMPGICATTVVMFVVVWMLLW